jgi:hypothetical protein
VGLAASCAFGTIGCSSEDEPDNNGQDAATDVTRVDVKGDTSVRTDVSTGTDAKTDTSADAGAPDGGGADAKADTRADALPDGGGCNGAGDAARDGALGMMAVQALRCANCHQDQPVDAGLILSGRSTSLVADAGVFPKNLTPDPATGLGCWTDDQIIRAIMDGIDEKGEMLCSRMPKFDTRIDGGVAQQIVDFLRTIPAVNKTIPETTSCPPPPGDAGRDADGATPPTDGGTDGAAPDGAAPDAAPDGTTTPEAGTDAAAPDAAPDAGADAGADGGVDDAGVDAMPDTGAEDAADSG